MKYLFINSNRFQFWFPGKTVILLFLILAVLTAQNSNSRNRRQLYENPEKWPFSRVKTSDRGMIKTGRKMVPISENWDIYVIRTDKNGDTLWSRTYDYKQNHDCGLAIRETGDGGYIVGGYTESKQTEDRDAYIMKLDPAGKREWEKVLGSKMDDVIEWVHASEHFCCVARGKSYPLDQDTLYPWLMQLHKNSEIMNLSGFEELKERKAVHRPVEEGDVIRYEQADVKPQPIHSPVPHYPELARRDGIQGEVTVEALVGIDGKIEDVGIYESSGNPLLDNSATETAREFVFTPAKKQGKKVKVWIKIPFQFRM